MRESGDLLKRCLSAGACKYGSRPCLARKNGRGNSIFGVAAAFLLFPVAGGFPLPSRIALPGAARRRTRGSPGRTPATFQPYATDFCEEECTL